jgi:hypothetical protein
MPPVLVEIGPRPADADEDEIEFVDDLDQIVETTMCSCNAGDDNPYSTQPRHLPRRSAVPGPRMPHAR